MGVVVKLRSSFARIGAVVIGVCVAGSAYAESGPRDEVAATDASLECGGLEPTWSISISGGKLRYADATGGHTITLALSKAVEGLPHVEYVAKVYFDEGGRPVALVRDSACVLDGRVGHADTPDDMRFPKEIFFFHDGKALYDSPRTLFGCCR